MESTKLLNQIVDEFNHKFEFVNNKGRFKLAYNKVDVNNPDFEDIKFEYNITLFYIHPDIVKDHKVSFVSKTFGDKDNDIEIVKNIVSATFIREFVQDCAFVERNNKLWYKGERFLRIPIRDILGDEDGTVKYINDNQ